MEEFYNSNENFKTYVDRYATMYGCDVSVALTHAIVIEVYEYYKNGGTK